MVLEFIYNGISYTTIINWTDSEGQSVVFRDITKRLSELLRFKADAFMDLAAELDHLTDKLYDLFYIFTNEHANVPYNPRFRRMLLNAFSELSFEVEEIPEGNTTEFDELLNSLYNTVLDKLQETVDVFLEDHAYQGKHRYRRLNMEQLTEATDERLMAFEFENVLIQMTDLSRLLDCLTDTQRSRLVKHIFLKYTLQEIAEQEGVAIAVAHRSITAALKKLQQQMTS